MNEALGMVETKGLVAAIEAADSMVKAANVENNSPGMKPGRFRAFLSHYPDSRQRSLIFAKFPVSLLLQTNDRAPATSPEVFIRRMKMADV